MPGLNMRRPPIHRDDVGALTRLEGAQLVEVRGAARIAARPYCRSLGLCLREVDEYPRAASLRERRDTTQQIGPAAIRGVRSDPGPDARPSGVRSEAPEEGLRLAEAALRIGVVEGMREDSPKAALLDRAGDLAHVAIPIGDRRHAARQELEAAGERPRPQLARADQRFQRTHTSLQPLTPRHVLRQPAEEPHRRVGMDIDETGQDRAAIEMDDHAALLCPGRPDVTNGVSLDDYSARRVRHPS